MVHSTSTQTEEITFAELTALVKRELELNANSHCIVISEKYGISEATMSKLIESLRLQIAKA